MLVITSEDDQLFKDSQDEFDRPPSIKLQQPRANGETPADSEGHRSGREYRQAFQDIRSIAEVYETDRDFLRDRVRCEEMLNFFCATLHHLLYGALPQSQACMNDRRFAHACRNGMIIYVFAPWCGSIPNPSLLVSLAQGHLLSALRVLMESHRSNVLLLWLLWVGASHADGGVWQKWFICQLVEMLDDMNIDSRQAMRNVLRQVLWNCQQDEKRFNQVWECVVKQGQSR